MERQSERSLHTMYVNAAGRPTS